MRCLLRQLESGGLGDPGLSYCIIYLLKSQEIRGAGGWMQKAPQRGALFGRRLAEDAEVSEDWLEVVEVAVLGLDESSDVVDGINREGAGHGGKIGEDAKDLVALLLEHLFDGDIGNGAVFKDED